MTEKCARIARKLYDEMDQDDDSDFENERSEERRVGKECS